MELIYLWVEDYKNIKNQEFNFSSKFNCHYNGETLTIKENIDENGKKKKYIENFFANNINVTAIVGKNGSGKSSIFELIIESLYSFYNSSKFYPSLFVFYNKDKDSFTYISDYAKKIESKKTIHRNRLWMPKVNFFTLHYDYSLTRFRPYKKNRTSDSWNPYSLLHENTLYDKDIEYIQSIPQKSGENYNENIFMNSDYDKLVIVKNIVLKSYIESSNRYFEPKYIEISEMIGISKKFSWLNDLRYNELSGLRYMELMAYAYILNLIENTFKGEGRDKLIRELEPFTSFERLKEYLNDDKKLFMKWVNGYLKEQKDYFYIKHVLEYAKLLEIYQKKEKNILFYKAEMSSKSTPPTSPIWEISNEEFNEQNIEILTRLPLYCFQIKIYDKNRKEYDELSNGEKSVLRIRFYIESILEEKKQDNFLILLDEPANDMHPDWRKKLFSYLIDTFKGRKQNIHFIFTTHSPFMISDLPKENIIFLKDGKNDKGINHKQTFGANIHTLLSDSFFMEDGLMGEFAKNKIMQIQKFHKKVLKYQENKKVKKAYICFYNKKQKEFEQIQSIIGEPFLKTIVKNQLEEIEFILFEEKAKKIAIKRFISEFGKDAINEVMGNDKD